MANDFSKEIKSNRLLQSLRYTLQSSDNTEAYTNVLDLNASEIYTQQNLLPTASTELPYSGSSGHLQYVTASVDGSSVNIAQYYSKVTMSRSNKTFGSGKSEAWLAISGSGYDPVNINSTTGVNTQTINEFQLTDWLSNKYIQASDANNKAEGDPPGYNIQLTVDGTPVSAGFQFDYKTGILQFESQTFAPSTTSLVAISGYRYVGQTLNEYISSGGDGGSGIFIQTGSFFATTNTLQITGSLSITPGTLNELSASFADRARQAGFAFTAKKLVAAAEGAGNLNLAGNLTASNMVASGHISASQFSGTPGTTNELTASYAISASYAVSGDITPGGNDTEIQFNSGGSVLGGSPRLTFDSTTGKTTVSGSLIISGSDSNDIFLIKSGSIDIAKVDNNGNFILVERTGATPTAVGGGIMFSSSALYVGI